MNFITTAVTVEPYHFTCAPSPNAAIDDSPADLSEWQLDRPPNVNATGHLIFETVKSLLQHWANTRMRIGHSIVPGMVPSGILLYHGTMHNELPPGPQWVATDPEHSMLFCGGMIQGMGCWHLTLITTRPLKVLYFDGSSAAKISIGTMAAQDIIIWDKVLPNRTLEEGRRIEELCAWGKEYSIDGFVRMEMDL
ncbi:hypothetical protein ID866_8213 [Astraeus odoratus]|nr:hypothetical protein ID866_8213 [Astraeus odoratus]